MSDPDSPRIHQPRRALPTDVVRPTRAEVHLAHLRHNLGVLKRHAGATPIWAVLKADGYGHGAKAVARTLERAGVEGVCVALVEEGVELREAGIRVPILVMGGYYGDAFRELVHHRLTPVLSDRSQVESLQRAVSQAAQQPVVCHVKVDTGMARMGTRLPEVPAFIRSLKDAPQIEVQGLMTHLANADVLEPLVFEEPLRLFAEAKEQFQQGGLSPSVLHMANSAAILRDPRTHLGLVRPGIALFGVDPLRGSMDPKPVNLKPAMSVHSRVVSLRELPAGAAAGYGGTFTAKVRSIIATVPMGYADGLPRALSNRGYVLVQGARAPIVGNVSMDMIMIDVTNLPSVKLMDEVVILGSQKGAAGEGTITATEVANWAGTIPWEILTNISRRVPRFYREA